MAVEIAQHYRVLGLSRQASSDEVRAAYLELAKKWHPDVNPRRNALLRFQRINDAYSALALREPEPPEEAAKPSNASRPVPQRVRIPVPLACSRCGEQTVEPRQASFTAVLSLLVVSWRMERGGLFCPSCARAASLKASLLSGLFGWWSLPGLLLTPLAVLRNARGGRKDEAANLRFLCHNLQAFEAAGNEEAARRLAYVLARTPSSVAVKINMSVAALIATDTGNCGSGRDEWKPRMGHHLLHVTAGAAVPITIAAALLS